MCNERYMVASTSARAHILEKHFHFGIFLQRDNNIVWLFRICSFKCFMVVPSGDTTRKNRFYSRNQLSFDKTSHSTIYSPIYGQPTCQICLHVCVSKFIHDKLQMLHELTLRTISHVYTNEEKKNKLLTRGVSACNDRTNRDLHLRIGIAYTSIKCHLLGRNRTRYGCIGHFMKTNRINVFERKNRMCRSHFTVVKTYTHHIIDTQSLSIR